MWKGQLKYTILWIFLSGVALIVLAQFISGENTSRLISGNKRLLNEVKIQNNLRQLQSDILTIESDIRGSIIIDDTSHVTKVREKFASIEGMLKGLRIQLSNEASENEVVALDALVRKKIDFSYRILDAYQKGGKEAAEAVINTGYGIAIRDSIITSISGMNVARQTRLNSIISSIEKSGTRARIWIFVMAAIACISFVFAFLYIVNKGRHQQRMIAMLNESEKKIKEASLLKEQFLANMSHEIRTPMNAVLGFTNLLKKTELTSQQWQYVDYIYAAGENLLILINDILDLSKIEAGMMNIEKAPFSLNGLVSSVETMFKEKARLKRLDFTIDIDPEIHDTLSGDAVRLTQILINLLSNAVKFTEKGFVTLAVRQVKSTPEETTLEFRVRDSGVGIAPEKRQSIFNRFQQAEAETTRRFGGTGLGLSIVKQLVDLQNGAIELHSEAGKGSEFIVTLPFKPVHDYAETHAVVLEETKSTKEVKVLVAEDNQMNQQLIRHLMKQWGVDYKVVNNGKEVIDSLKEEPFSLVLMDIQMPEMDGYTATTCIRNELKLEVPIIAMTAHAMAGEKERCISFGMTDYISKPVKEKELYSILQTHAQPVSELNSAARFIDLNYLKELSLGDTEFEQTIIQQFIIQVPEELDMLQQAIDEKNKQKIKNIAHGMKSSVAYLGLSEKVYPFLQRMEAEAASNEPSDHFQEDYVQVKLICQQAIEEARRLTAIEA